MLNATRLCVCGLAIAAAESAFAGPVITPEQIEADWLRQDELRANPLETPAPKRKVTLEEDAAGAVDGHIDGLWGFHTENEPNPWWQVDLGGVAPLDRVTLYNRCDNNMGARNARIMVLLSDDGKQFNQVYQHDGGNFGGKPDDKPLVVPLEGKQARYVRLQLPGTSYFHLDEVQVYSGDKNIALGKPATQSSLSQWSAPPKGKPDAPPPAAQQAAQPPRTYPIAEVIQRGLKLAENLRGLGAKCDDQEKTLREIAERLAETPGASTTQDRDLYMRAHWAVRKMALANPLLDFDEILFVKRASGLFPHVSDQYYGWWSRGGGGVYVLSGFKGDHPTLRCLTEQFAVGNFLRPDISYDGKRVLFAYCKHYPHVADIPDKTRKENLPEDAFYHVFETNVDGTGLRQLTRGYYDDFDARYLPDGDIVFLSTRKGTALQAGKQSAAATCEATRPDSYVRCGGGRHRPVAVFTLHRMDPDGKNLHAISAFENFEWTPSIAGDGRILYARWDYIDRFNGHFMSLWSTNPNGTNAQLVYGNYTVRPQCVFEARQVPDSHKLVFTATAHHSNTGGSLVLLDRTQGTEYDRPITRLTPEVCFPETEGWPTAYYSGPWPLSEVYYLCAWSDKPLPKHSLMRPDDPNNPRNASGVYLFDAFGNLSLLYRDPDISSADPIPVRPRTKPPQAPNVVEWDAPQEGRFFVQDVYQGLGDLPRGTITGLRIVGVLPKVQPEMNSPVLGVSREDPGKFVLGTVPVERDGSAFFRAPSGIPYFFQALDCEGHALRTMRSLTYVQPNQTLACVGCHEPRDLTPLPGNMPLAAARDASRVRPEPEGTWPLRYDRLVQPVLDRYCVECHKPGAKDAAGAKFDLTPAKSYDTLLHWSDDDLLKLANERDYSPVGHCPSRQSKVMALLSAGHHDVRLDPESNRRLAVWMDTYAHRQGAFSEQQEEELRQLRQKMAQLLDE
jgi:hypothetical protein